MTFGKLIENIRIERRITLKELGSDIGFDPAYISRIESGKIKPSGKFVNAFNEYFGFETKTYTHDQLVDLASIARSEIPEYIMNDQEVVNKLPLLFRTISGERTSSESIDKLIALIKENESFTSETDV